MNPSIAAQQYESISHSTQGTEPRLGLQTDPYKRTRATWLKYDSCNDTGCNEQWPMHDTTQLNSWQGAIHNHMVTIKIWIYDRISRVTWVSSVRQLQIWLKNFYRWSKKKKLSRCEENEWGVKNNTNTRSIPNLDQNILDSTSNSSPIRKKVIRWSRRISQKIGKHENMSIELKIEPRIKQMMRYWARDRCTV